jgi:hypothetical protein
MIKKNNSYCTSSSDICVIRSSGLKVPPPSVKIVELSTVIIFFKKLLLLSKKGEKEGIGMNKINVP